MTLTHPYPYWQRANSYENTLAASDNDVYNRNEAINTTDLHVRSYLHSRVTITTTTTNPPPVDWFAGLDFLQQAMWTPAPVTIIGTANDGTYGMFLTAPLVLTTRSLIAAPGRDVATWSCQKVESARVYHSVPDDNSDFPSVQSGFTVFDRGNVLSHSPAYTYTITFHQYLETLWASKSPVV